ncbi:ATP-binding protein [Paenibacillus chitinolyticus]|uniref:ATP-binding protein n=1 Tax=Paenibacillus chitinolyticus TaxID=79263 RepID=UPI00366E28A4
MNSKKKWMILFFIGIIFLQFWCLRVAYRYPYLGIIVDQNPKQEWVITQLERVSIGSKIGFKPDDKILSVDGKRPEEHLTVKKYYSIEQADVITVLRGDKELTFTTRDHATSMTVDILSLLGEIIAFVFAFLICSRLSKSRSALMLSAVFLNIGLIFMCLGASTRTDILAKGMTTSLVACLPFLFLQFLIMFFQERSNFIFSTRYMKYVYAAIGFSSLLQLSMFFPEANFKFYKIIYYGTMSFFIAGFIMNIYLLAHLYKKYRKSNDYLFTIIKTIIFCLGLSFCPLAFLNFIPRILFQTELAFSYYSGWFILFFPVTFGYLIMSKQLYDLDIILRRVFYTAVISVLPSAVLVAVNYFIFQKDATLKHMVISFTTTMVVLTFVTYSLEYFATRLEKIMFPRKYYLQQALKKIANALGSITNFRELRDIVLVDIVDILQVYGGAIVIQYASGTLEIISEGNIDEQDVKRRFLTGDWFDSEYTRTLIKGHEEYVSYLVMAKKKTNTFMNREETQWLSLIISYLSVSLENLYLIRKLNMKLLELASELPNQEGSEEYVWFRKTMFDLQEKERTRIATDLHDTTMQDIFFVQRKLKNLQKQMLNPDEHRQLKDILNHLELINMNLRQCCFELNPYLLKNIGLVRALQNLVDTESSLGDYEIQFVTEGKTTAMENLDYEAKRHIFRVIQELITNAKKHSQASRLFIRLVASGNEVTIHYEDDGIGFKPNSSSGKTVGRSGMGLEQMKGRVLHLNGQFTMESMTGKGVEVRIQIPIKEGIPT